MKQKKIKEEIFILLEKADYHQRELARIIKTSQTNIRRALIDLEKDNILEHRCVGKSKIYSIKSSLEADVFRGIVEFYKLLRILEKDNIRRIYKEIKEKIISGLIDLNTIIILFGSYAKGLEKEKSDIDIYISSNSKKEKEQIESISDSINVSFGKFDKKNLLFEEIKKNHIILNNLDGWLLMLKKNE